MGSTSLRSYTVDCHHPPLSLLSWPGLRRCPYAPPAPYFRGPCRDSRCGYSGAKVYGTVVMDSPTLLPPVLLPPLEACVGSLCGRVKIAVEHESGSDYSVGAPNVPAPPHAVHAMPQAPVPVAQTGQQPLPPPPPPPPPPAVARHAQERADKLVIQPGTGILLHTAHCMRLDVVVSVGARSASQAASEPPALHFEPMLDPVRYGVNTAS